MRRMATAHARSAAQTRFVHSTASFFSPDPSAATSAGKCATTSRVSKFKAQKRCCTPPYLVGALQKSRAAKWQRAQCAAVCGCPLQPHALVLVVNKQIVGVALLSHKREPKLHSVLLVKGQEGTDLTPRWSHMRKTT